MSCAVIECCLDHEGQTASETGVVPAKGHTAACGGAVASLKGVTWGGWPVPAGAACGLPWEPTTPLRVLTAAVPVSSCCDRSPPLRCSASCMCQPGWGIARLKQVWRGAPLSKR